MNPWDDVRTALNAAKDADSAVRNHARQMAPLLVGKLRHINEYDAAQLKKELRDFNIHTGKWKKK